LSEIRFTLNIEGPEGFSVDFPVPEGSALIGRQTGNELVLAHTQVSRNHARLDASAGECTVTDLGSSNGTHLNGEKLEPNTPTRLKGGDRVKIGPFQIEVTEEKAVEETVEIELPPEPGVPPPPGLTPPLRPVAVNGHPRPAPGLGLHSSFLLDYLPGIYQTDFMSRFLGIFEATLLPVEWTIDNFDQFLDPETSPGGFLPWLASWYGLVFDSTWSEAKRRQLLSEAHEIFARRGTRRALSRVLEIYTGAEPEIDDDAKDLEPFTFSVVIPRRKRDVRSDLIEALIDVHKPAHTTYSIKYKK
jgi:phage tail-like protein